MAALRFWLSLSGVVLFAACALVLILAFLVRAFSLEQFAWVEPVIGAWLFGALLVVLLLRFVVTRVEQARGRG
jgi:hypothetical protein